MQSHRMLDLRKVSISLVALLGIAPILIGGVSWLTSIDAKANKAIEKAAEASLNLSEQGKLLRETHDTVIRIEERIKRR